MQACRQPGGGPAGRQAGKGAGKQAHHAGAPALLSLLQALAVGQQLPRCCRGHGVRQDLQHGKRPAERVAAPCSLAARATASCKWARNQPQAQETAAAPPSGTDNTHLLSHLVLMVVGEGVGGLVVLVRALHRDVGVGVARRQCAGPPLQAGLSNRAQDRRAAHVDAWHGCSTHGRPQGPPPSWQAARLQVPTSNFSMAYILGLSQFQSGNRAWASSWNLRGVAREEGRRGGSAAMLGGGGSDAQRRRDSHQPRCEAAGNAQRT